MGIMRGNAADGLKPVLIPEFDERGLLPQGLYDVSLSEIRQALDFTPRRVSLMDGLERYARIWDRSGFADYFIIDGSFVTAKLEPGDMDLILVPRQRAFLSMPFYGMVNRLVIDKRFVRREFGCEAFLAADRAYLDRWMAFFGAAEEGGFRGLLRLRFSL